MPTRNTGSPRRAVVLARLAGLCTVMAACASPGPAAGATQEVVIHATDYAFRVPQTAKPGPTVFVFSNEGSVVHEVQLFRISKEISADSIGRMLARDDVPEHVVDPEAGVLIGPPGTTVTQKLLIELKAGEIYGLRCEFDTGPTKTKHSKMGMFWVLRVE